MIFPYRYNWYKFASEYPLSQHTKVALFATVTFGHSAMFTAVRSEKKKLFFVVVFEILSFNLEFKHQVSSKYNKTYQ